MNEYRIYCGGEFVTTAKKLDVTEKYSGKIFAYTYLTGEEEFNKAVEAALKIKSDCASLPSWKKYEALTFIATKITEKKEDLAALLCRESGKPMIYAIAEIERAAQTFLIAAEESKRLPKEFISLDWTKNSSKTQRHRSNISAVCH